MGGGQTPDRRKEKKRGRGIRETAPKCKPEDTRRETHCCVSEGQKVLWQVWRGEKNRYGGHPIEKRKWGRKRVRGPNVDSK